MDKTIKLRISFLDCEGGNLSVKTEESNQIDDDQQTFRAPLSIIIG